MRRSAILVALLIGCGDGGAAQQQAVQAAYAEYAEACKRGDLGEGGFKTTFAAWWKSYAAARGLPGGD
jgi:hypothetical protein